MKAILAKSSTDQHKSKIQNEIMQLLVLEVEMTPTEFGRVIDLLSDQEFDIEIPQLKQ